ncbi:MAG TPA: hypothetical protein VIY70_01850 [Acidimicrobiia bacterium]
MNASAEAGSLRRGLVPLGMFLREYYRTPLNLVLLAVIPVLLIAAFGNSLSRLAGMLEIALSPAMGQAMGAMWSAAFLTGIMGFFMMIGAREADRRMVRAGYSPLQVVSLRFAAVALLGAGATVVSYVVLLSQVTPSNPAQTLLVLYMGAMIYGTVGVLIGSLVAGELEGSFALLFFFVMDAFIASPLFGDAAEIPFGFLPTYYPTKVLLYLTAERPHDAVHWLYIALYLAVAGTLAARAFYRSARVR